MKKTKTYSTVLAMVALSASAFSNANGAVVSWNFGTASGSLSPSAGVPITGLTVTDLTRGNGGGGATTSSLSASDYSGASGQFNALASGKNGAFDANTSTFWEFSLTGDGASFSLTDISFGSRSTASGPVSYSVRSSLNSYGSDLASGTVLANSAWSLQSPATTDTAGLPGETITYRLYGFGGTTTASNWRIDDLAITVTVDASPVPEPTTYAGIAGGLLLGFAVWRRAGKQS